MSSTEYPDLPPVAADAHGSARGTWLLWAGPFVLLGAALLILGLHIRRRRRLAPAPLQAAESERLRQLLGEEKI